MSFQHNAEQQKRYRPTEWPLLTWRSVRVYLLVFRKSALCVLSRCLLHQWDRLRFGIRSGTVLARRRMRIIHEACMFSHHAQRLLRRAMGCMQASFPFTDRLLAHFQLIGELALGQAHMFAQGTNLFWRPDIFWPPLPGFCFFLAHACLRVNHCSPILPIGSIVSRVRLTLIVTRQRIVWKGELQYYGRLAPVRQTPAWRAQGCVGVRAAADDRSARVHEPAHRGG